MEPKNANQIKDLVKQYEDPRVYEGEIIYEGQDPAAVKKKIDNLPSKKFAYKLGKMVGSVITVLGVINEVGRWVKTDRKRPEETRKGRGRRMRRFRRRR
ncbi:MAG: hypothetical protein PVH61_39810 [Candidatus Aminicenantes bacterium]